MIPNHIKVKFFVEAPNAVDLPAFIPLFHRWIQKKTVEGLLIDVADYQHVPEGPGILLMGHEGNYAMDMANGRPGLLYSRKREWGDDKTLQQRLHTVFRLAFNVGSKASKDELAATLTEEKKALEKVRSQNAIDNACL